MLENKEPQGFHLAKARADLIGQIESLESAIHKNEERLADALDSHEP